MVKYEGSERRKFSHDCLHEEEMGMIKEFIANNKSIRSSLNGIIIVIVVQIISFAFLWGQLTAVVTKNTDFIWEDLGPAMMANTININKILAKLDNIKIVKVEEHN